MSPWTMRGGYFHRINFVHGWILANTVAYILANNMANLSLSLSLSLIFLIYYTIQTERWSAA